MPIPARRAAPLPHLCAAQDNCPCNFCSGFTSFMFSCVVMTPLLGCGNANTASPGWHESFAVNLSGNYRNNIYCLDDDMPTPVCN